MSLSRSKRGNKHKLLLNLQIGYLKIGSRKTSPRKKAPQTLNLTLTPHGGFFPRGFFPDTLKTDAYLLNLVSYDF